MKVRWLPARHSLLIFAVFALGLSSASAEDDEDYRPQSWREAEVRFPDAPKPENLAPFYFSAASENKAYVDKSSLTVGNDGVVRYTLVVVTAQGGRNVTYEGMRCETRERRIYASGRSDGSWVASRNAAWSRIREEYVNRYHAALFLDYFCPIGVIARDAEEIREALRLGVHRDNQRW